jgi:hypothetical protein
VTSATSSRLRVRAGDERRAPCQSYRASYRRSYRANYRVWFCSWRPSRPRQHWGLVVRPSPTTRPPRGNSVGWVAGSRTRAWADERCWRGRGRSGSAQQASRPNRVSGEGNRGKGFLLQLFQRRAFGDGSLDVRVRDLDVCRGGGLSGSCGWSWGRVDGWASLAGGGRCGAF